MNGDANILKPNTLLNRDRLKATIGAVILHALIGYGLLYGLGIDPVRVATQSMKVFNVAPEVPLPPMETVPAVVRVEKPEGTAAPPSLPPTPIVAPKPEIELEVPSPVIAAPKAGAGSSNSEGTANVAGTGTGSGGIGNGTGSGGLGDGTGGGGSGVRAQRLRGGIRDSDYPKAARKNRVSGTVHVRIAVGPDGSVDGCSVTKSSGHPLLDSTTCRLITQRFRYRPARDAAGRPVAGEEFTNFTWSWQPQFQPPPVTPADF